MMPSEQSPTAVTHQHPYIVVGQKKFTMDNISWNPGYMHVYDFEKLDYIHIYQKVISQSHIYMGVGLLYLILVVALRKWMEGRKPFQLRRILFLWNVLLSALSTVIFCRTLPEVVHVVRNYGFYVSYCKQDYMNAATAFWGMIFGISKLVDFGDTVFVLLRRQPLTFLHTFHHVSMYTATFWGGMLFDPAGRYVLVINSFIHIVMYAYFALKAAQVKLSRKVSMAVTSIQLLQFLSAIILNCLSLYAVAMETKPACERPRELHMIFFVLGVAYFYLFSKFFMDSYVRNKDKKAK